MSLNAHLEFGDKRLCRPIRRRCASRRTISRTSTREGYHRRVVHFGPQLTGGRLNGVTIDEIRRIADDFLAREATSRDGRVRAAPKF